MGLSFLAPLFLAGLAALAIPIIVHLIHKQKDNVVPFPSLMFVRRIPYKTTSKQRIRHWFLLLLRCLALILIAAAFARPWVNRENPAPVEAGGARELVVLLDRSYSMGYGDRWAKARRAAETAFGELRGDDRGTVVFFDVRAEAVRGDEGDLTPVTVALRDAKPGALGTRYAPAMRLAQSLLQTSPRPRREVMLITDFQRSGWSAKETVELPIGTIVNTVDVGSDKADNIAVAGVNFTRAVYAGSERVTVNARVINRSAEPVNNLPVALELATRVVATQRINVPANGVATASFEPFTVSSPNLRATVTAGTDALPVDNRFDFVLSPGQALPVLIARGISSRADESFYLERALEVEGAFAVTADNAPTLLAKPLPRNAVVVLHDAAVPGGAAGRRLREHVEAGGGLLVILGERMPRGDGGELLPGSVNGVIDREPGRPGRVAQVSYEQSLFEPFRSPRSGDFASARFYRYRELEPASDATVLARFDDGRAALVEKRIGRGRVLAWASPLDNLWSDFALQPVFLPFVHQLAHYASNQAAPTTSHVAGAVLDLTDRVRANPDREMLVAYPSGKSAKLDGGQSFIQLDEQGFYQIRASGQSASAATTVAANPDLAESDLSRIPAADVKAALLPTGEATAKLTAEELAPAERERRQAAWWYLLVIAAMLLAAESIISNRLSRVARA